MSEYTEQMQKVFAAETKLYDLVAYEFEEEDSDGHWEPIPDDIAKAFGELEKQQNILAGMLLMVR